MLIIGFNQHILIEILRFKQVRKKKCMFLASKRCHFQNVEVCDTEDYLRMFSLQNL